MRSFQIAVLPGDGIGPEVIDAAVKILQVVERCLDGLNFEVEEFSGGATEYLRAGDPFPPATFERCRQADAILLGAMGLPEVRWPGGTEIAPQLDLREKLDLYCGLRPVRLYHANDTPLKGYAAGDVDLVIVRENTEGMFSSRSKTFASDAGEVTDTLRISRRGAERIFRAAFRQASNRRSLVTLVDKANVLPSMSFFRRIFDEVSAEFPAVRTEKIYADAATVHLLARPHTFDVIVTENLLGDILSDLTAGLAGGLGMAPSADIGEHHAVFQPCHGSAPDIAGRGIANPTAAILSVAMMLEWLGCPESAMGAHLIQRAVANVYTDPCQRTRELGGSLDTRQMGDLIAAEVIGLQSSAASQESGSGNRAAT